MGSQAFTTPGQTSFTVPSGVTVITVRCYGGGGPGGSSNRAGGRGGGGGGGNFAESTIAVSPGETYGIQVGSGGIGLTENRSSSFNYYGSGKPIVLATGGNRGANVSSSTAAFGAGATASTLGCIGVTIRIGGAGGNGVDNGSGAGGGCAGPSGVGANASSNTAGAGNSPGGNGANGVSPTSGGVNGSTYGGGGSGGATPDIYLSGVTRLGGSGGNGAVTIGWADAPPANVCICLYSNCSTISAGCYLYSNVSLTAPVNPGYYSDSTYCYTVTTGGYVSSVSNCSGGSEDYYHYYVNSYACPGCGTTSDPANGLVASASALTTGYYYYDSISGNVYYLSSYYGFGQYSGQVINPSSGFTSCSVACSV